MSRNALGKGLSALIREPEPQAPAPEVIAARAPSIATEVVEQIETDLIDPSPYQPRIRFREEALEELASSIRSSGIIQPLLLRGAGRRFQLVAGERRWRAAQRAGLRRVPAVVRDVPEELALELTLVENLQREDLNPIEQAGAFDRLIREFHLTQEEVAERTGKDRATIANALRLLKLERPIQEMMEDGRLTAGHGRALLGIQDSELRQATARRAARGAFSVRQLERLASRRARASEPATEEAMEASIDPNTRAAVDELQQALGTRVILHPRTERKPGQLVIEYYQDGDLMRIYDRIMKA
jgi:ParB family chromosome partitioning protein